LEMRFKEDRDEYSLENDLMVVEEKESTHTKILLQELRELRVSGA